VMVGLLILFGANQVCADSKAEKEARFAEKVKAGIGKLSTGEDARVEVKLRDKTKLKGYISEADEDSFVVVGNDGAATRVEYARVKQVKGNNLSTGARIAITVGIAFALVLLIGLAAAA
jgi:hypothetical protein